LPIEPLAQLPLDPLIAALPKADVHLHHEERPRLDRIVARRQSRPPYDWQMWARRLMTQTPPGHSRLSRLFELDEKLDLAGVRGDDPEDIIAKMSDVLEEGAADGALLIEVRCGVTSQALSRSDAVTLFREAERRVQVRWPRLRAELIAHLGLVGEAQRLHSAEQQLKKCLQMARDGLAGIDFRVDPYAEEANPAHWEVVYGMGERAADAGLGITVHAGEFSTANIAAALRIPGLKRLGHGVYVASDPQLMEDLAQSGITVECCLSCNVVTGAVPSYEAHPMRQYVACGIPVTLNTDDPVRVCTTIGREYAIAARLGFSPAELLAFTRNAVVASFTSDERRRALLVELDVWSGEELERSSKNGRIS
jgi:adenosine deaminase